MHILVAIALLAGGAALNQRLLRASPKWADRVAFGGMTMLVCCFAFILFETNRRAPGETNEPNSGLILSFWLMAFSGGLSAHRAAWRRGEG